MAHFFGSGSDEAYHLNQNDGYAFAAPDDDDARKLMLYTHTDGKVFLTKWVDQATRADWVPVIRYAEVILNRAETLVRDGGGTVTGQAVNLLNAVRTRPFPDGEYEVMILLRHRISMMRFFLKGTLNYLEEASEIRTSCALVSQFLVKMCRHWSCVCNSTSRSVILLAGSG